MAALLVSLLEILVDYAFVKILIIDFADDANVFWGFGEGFQAQIILGCVGHG